MLRSTIKGGKGVTVVFIVADSTSASSRLRVLQYLVPLERDDVRVRVCATRPSKYMPSPRWLQEWRLILFLYHIACAGLVIAQRVWQILWIVPTATTVFMQKDMLFRSRLKFLERLLFLVARLWRIRVVFDLDDAIYLGTSTRPLPHMRAKVAYITRAANSVSAGSRPIKSQLRRWNREVSLLPTCISLGARPDRSYDIGDRSLRLIWTGTASNARHLEMLCDALNRLRCSVPFRLEVVTRLAEVPEGLLHGFPIHFTEWSEASEARALFDADVALAPLADNAWTRSKCGARLLAYFAAALPIVASPVGAQGEMICHGVNGLAASDADEWTSCLMSLYRSGPLRGRLGRNGRRFVEEHFDARKLYPQWRDFLLGR